LHRFWTANPLFLALGRLLGARSRDHSAAVNNAFRNRLIIKAGCHAYFTPVGDQAPGRLSTGLGIARQIRRHIMLTKSKIALSLAIVLGTASVAMAAPKHPVHRQQTTVERQVPASAYLSYGSARGKVSEPAYMRIQDQDLKNSLGL
jgi:hypothetical protein